MSWMGFIQNPSAFLTDDPLSGYGGAVITESAPDSCAAKTFHEARCGVAGWYQAAAIGFQSLPISAVEARAAAAAAASRARLPAALERELDGGRRRSVRSASMSLMPIDR